MSEQITDLVFYNLEKAIKTYRRFAQKRINEADLDITIDQWLVLTCLDTNKDIQQNQLAEMTFKDVASVTRIIDLLVKKEYLHRSMHGDDRRRFVLDISRKGKSVLAKANRLVEDNRAIALNGISKDKVLRMKETLALIIKNCQD